VEVGRDRGRFLWAGQVGEACPLNVFPYFSRYAETRLQERADVRVRFSPDCRMRIEQVGKKKPSE
jgi:hypothetical protein